MKKKHRKMWDRAAQVLRIRRRAREELATAERHMTHTRCPHAGRNCTAERCIHYQPGRVNRWSGLSLLIGHSCNPPRCKLWGPER